MLPHHLFFWRDYHVYKYLFRVHVQQRWECASFTLFARGIWLQRQILGWPVRDGNHLRTSSAIPVSILCGSLWGRLMSELRVPRPTKKQFNLVQSSHGSFRLITGPGWIVSSAGWWRAIWTHQEGLQAWDHRFGSMSSLVNHFGTISNDVEMKGEGSHSFERMMV